MKDVLLPSDYLSVSAYLPRIIDNHHTPLGQPQIKQTSQLNGSNRIFKIFYVSASHLRTLERLKRPEPRPELNHS